VVVTARTTASLETVAGHITQMGVEALTVTADLGVDADIQRIVSTALQRFGRIDILVNNAGIIHPRINLVDFEGPPWCHTR
jgi:short-subunit dehydrogenase